MAQAQVGRALSEREASLRDRLRVQIQQRANLSSSQQQALTRSLGDFVAAGGQREPLMDVVMSALQSGCDGTCLTESVGALNRVRERGLGLVSAATLVTSALEEVGEQTDRQQLSLSSLRESEIRERLATVIDQRLMLRNSLGLQVQRQANLSADQQLALMQPLDLFVASGGKRQQLMGVVMTALDSGCDGLCLAEGVRALNRARLLGGLDEREATEAVGGALRELEVEYDEELSDRQRAARLRELVNDRLR